MGDIMLDIRRNDYINAIRNDVNETKIAISDFDKLEQEAKDLIDYCKENKLRKFKRVAKLELKILRQKHRWHKRYLKRLRTLLYKAEVYAPPAKR